MLTWLAWPSNVFPIFCFFLNWSIVDLQYCDSFRCTEKWFSYIYIYIYIYICIYFRLFSIIGYYRILNIVPCVIHFLFSTSIFLYFLKRFFIYLLTLLMICFNSHFIFSFSKYSFLPLIPFMLSCFYLMIECSCACIYL